MISRRGEGKIASRRLPILQTGHSVLRFLFVTVTLLALTACSSTKAPWQKDGVSDFDTANFESECRFQTGLAKIKGDQAEELVELCMRGKGFRRK